MSNSNEEEELFARMTGAHFASMLTLALALAARTHATEIRKALAAVFDLSPLEKLASLAQDRAEEALRIAQEARQAMEDVEARLSKARKAFDALRHELGQLSHHQRKVGVS